MYQLAMLHVLLQATSEQVTIARATQIIALFNALYLIATILLWLSTRRNVLITKNMFEASHRPYVGPKGVMRQDSPDLITFDMRYQNVGTVPASQCQPTLRVITDGVLVPMVAKEVEEHSVAFPGIEYAIRCTITEPSELKMIKDASNIAVVFKCSYKGVANKPYTSEEKSVYSKVDGLFMTVHGVYT